MFRKLIVLGAGVLVALTGVAGAAAGGSATRPDGLYRGRAALLIPAASELAPSYLGLHRLGRSSTPITPGSRAGMASISGADYAATEPCDTTPCAAAKLRVMVFKTAALAKTYWKKACPGCGYRKSPGGWPFLRAEQKIDRSQPLSPTNASVITSVAVCGNLVIPVKGTSWGDGRFAVEVIQSVIDAAVAAGMRTCDPLKLPPPARSGVFARGTMSGDQARAVASGTVSRPRLIFARIKAGSNEAYVIWELNCKKGGFSQTTRDEGWVDTGTTEVALTTPVVNPDSCTASVSAQIKYFNTITVELVLG